MEAVRFDCDIILALICENVAETDFAGRGYVLSFARFQSREWHADSIYCPGDDSSRLIVLKGGLLSPCHKAEAPFTQDHLNI